MCLLLMLTTSSQTEIVISGLITVYFFSYKVLCWVAMGVPSPPCCGLSGCVLVALWVLEGSHSLGFTLMTCADCYVAQSNTKQEMVEFWMQCPPLPSQILMLISLEPWVRLWDVPHCSSLQPLLCSCCWEVTELQCYLKGRELSQRGLCRVDLPSCIQTLTLHLLNSWANIVICWVKSHTV